LPPSNAKPFPRTINNQNVSNCVLSQVGKKWIQLQYMGNRDGTVGEMARFELCEENSLLDVYWRFFPTTVDKCTRIDTDNDNKLEISTVNSLLIPWQPNSSRCRRWLPFEDNY
jgi:hypothetical protein